MRCSVSLKILLSLVVTQGHWKLHREVYDMRKFLLVSSYIKNGGRDNGGSTKLTKSGI